MSFTAAVDLMAITKHTTRPTRKTVGIAFQPQMVSKQIHLRNQWINVNWSCPFRVAIWRSRWAKTTYVV